MPKAFRQIPFVLLLIPCLVAGCAAPEPQLPPEKALPQAVADTTPPLAPEVPDTSSPQPTNLPPGYTLTDTTEWATIMEDGVRAVLRRGGVVIDTVDLAFGVAVVGKDSLVFFPVRTDTLPLSTTSVPTYESWPTEHVFWTPTSRRELRDLLPFFNAFISAAVAHGTAIYYWGVSPHDQTNRLYAMRYDFRTAHLDSLYLNREDALGTDYRYHLGTPQIHGNEVSFRDIVLDGTTWRIIREEPRPK